MSNIIVQVVNGHWTVNEKRIKECSFFEKKYFENFIKIHKYDQSKFI